MDKTVILTGLRANNDLHIGNYFGALRPIVDIANTYDSNLFQINLFVPDLHSFTTPVDHSRLFQQTIENIKMYVAAGLPIDKDNVFVYRQSFIPAHSELTWILDNFTTFSSLRRMQQFEDKAGLLKDQNADENSKDHLALRQSLSHDQLNSVSVGLFNYPVLMAADILLYDALYVPVGADQTQHLEFTRDLAESLNSRFKAHGELFVIPKKVKEQNEFFKKDDSLKIKDLINPDKKMSKSSDNDRGAIFLNDNPDDAAKKITGATTDNLALIGNEADKQPGIYNLLTILALINNNSVSETASAWIGKTSYSELKSTVADATKTFLVDFQTNLRSVNVDQVMAKVNSDEMLINERANKKLLTIQQAIGLRQS